MTLHQSRKVTSPSAMALMISVAACDPLLPPLLTINGMNRDNTTAFAISCSKKPIAVAVNNSPINVYPNPAQNELNVSGLDNTLGGEIRIHDLLGRRIYSSKISSSSVTIPVSNLIPGMYILEAFSENQKYFIRF